MMGLAVTMSAKSLAKAQAVQPSYTEWHDLQMNSINRLAPHTDFFGFRAGEVNGTTSSVFDRSSSRNYMSLDGMW